MMRQTLGHEASLVENVRKATTMGDSDFKAKRLTRTYCQTIDASPDEVFPLLCPVREAEWLDGWEYTMVYSESGLVEDGAVFSTPREGEEDTVWVVTKYDPQKRVVEFTRFTPHSRTCVLKISVRPKDGSGSYVDISYTFTGIAPSGNDFIDGFTKEKFLELVTFWEKSVSHFLETGRKLKKV